MKKIILSIIFITTISMIGGCKKDTTIKEELVSKPTTISITINNNVSQTVLVK